MLRLGNKKDHGVDYKCTIRLLDDNEVLECEFQSYHKGRVLLDYVFSRLNLIETDYFALRYVDQNKQRHWLDPNKNVLRQIKNLSPILFCFRVKFYPADPLRLQEEITRYQLFLQLRRDLLHGRLYCSQADAACLAAYIVQAEIGDFDPQKHYGNYISDFKILLKQTPKMEEKIMEYHPTLKGQTPLMAETCFLKKASLLDTYGVDPHPVKEIDADHRGSQLYLGLNHTGVLTFQGSRKTHHFRWADIQKLNYEGKMFIVHLIFSEKKHTVGFKCPTASACRHLWRCAVEQRLFYTLENSNKQGVVVTGGSFFSRGSRFRYAGRCEKEVVEESSSIIREPPTVNRISLRTIGRSTSLPTTPADSDTYDAVMSRVHRPLPYIDRSSSLDEDVLCGADTGSQDSTEGLNHINGGCGEFRTTDLLSMFKGPGAAYCPESTLPPLSLLEPLLEAQENKSRSSSILDSSFLDAESNLEPGSDPKGKQEEDHRSKDRNVGENSKDLKAKGEEAMLQQQLFYDYNGRGHASEFGDTSSTETLGPHNMGEPDLPLRDKNVGSGSQHHMSRSPTRKGKEPLRREKLEIAPLSLPPDLTRGGAQRLLRGRITRLSLKTFLRVFLVAFVFVVFALTCSVIFIFESESSLLQGLRSTREMMLLRIQYYQPLKDHMKSWLGKKS
ncbi:FERM domain-containing protein 5-like isoform X3 [Penaeus japonicus]|uniref:FERM domain-containing protein 5-like isoform X3 n=1 Tax=Penaeus japonicus TaxID=27405 RepID=UPI001C7169B7|nr:FERM domain-containing protein 5-like isoform X3 [Penaeus japonicus]